jgi:high-affinity nickel-transport protein
MTGVLPIAALGFFLGMRHATDPDHVIAVSTIVGRYRTMGGASLIGALWGVGHTLTILIVGGGIILFGWVIPERLGLSLEFAVGLLLILLGILNLRGIGELLNDLRHSGQGPVHAHPHTHGDYIHNHAHGHEPERHPHEPERTPLGWVDRHFGKLGLYQAIRPLIIGVVHGLAGSAAVALLVLATIPDPWWGMLYLLIFGLGTVVGMMLVTAVVALPFTYTQAHARRINAALRLASGVISLGFGLVLAYQIGVVGGLFGANPRWTPH